MATRQAWVQELLDKIDIADIFRKDGHTPDNQGFVNCPFHKEQNPSLKVYDDSWFCFGCNIGGSAIDYIIHRDNVVFWEAFKTLAAMYNHPLPNITPEKAAAIATQKEQDDEVLAIVKKAFEIYNRTMDTTRRGYYHQRGLTDKTIDRELLGFAEDATLGDLVKEQPHELLIKTGLFFYDGKKLTEAYRRRYVMPYWENGQIVYSIGRLDTDNPAEIEKLPKWNRGKYRKHLLFGKKYGFISPALRNIIWNADKVKEAKVGVIAEGIVDALLFKQEMTPRHDMVVISPVTRQFKADDIDSLIQLVRHWNHVYLIPDNEENNQGLDGAQGTADTLFQRGITNVHIVTLPRPANVQKVDLADVLNQPNREGACDALKTLIDNAPEYLRMRINACNDFEESEKENQVLEIINLLIELPDDSYAFDKYSEMITTKNAVLTKKRLGSLIKTQKRVRQREKIAKLKKTNPKQAVREEIRDTRLMKVKPFVIKEAVSDIVLANMRDGGTFFQNQWGDGCYWFDNDTKELKEIDRMPRLQSYIFERYGLNASESETEYLFFAMEAEAYNRGGTATIHHFVHFDRENGSLYIACSPNQMYKLNGKEITLLNNGEDNILFIVNKEFKPFAYTAGHAGEIDKHLLQHINFDDSDGILETDEQKYLFKVWMHVLFLSSLQPTKPLALFMGEQGSGKTYCNRSIGRTLFGDNFDVTGITNEEDFDAAVSNNHFIALDNVDDYLPWLPDRLAAAATGRKLEKRKLYTTNESVLIPMRCFVSLNTREPRFARPDVLDRLLIFRLKRFDEFIPEDILLSKIDAQRNALLSEMLDNLNEVIPTIIKNLNTGDFVTSFRMADFVRMGFLFSEAFGLGQMFLGIMNKMRQSQMEVLQGEDSLSLVLSYWLEDLGNHNRVMTTRDLFAELEDLAMREKTPFAYQSSRSLGRAIRQIIPSFSDKWDIEEKNFQNRRSYSFSLKYQG